MRTPLWSNIHGDSPKCPFQASPMSRYQSCSPGMKCFLTLVISFSISTPSCSSTGSPFCARSPPKSMKSKDEPISSISLNARPAFSMKRVLSVLG